jgi:hypothetical protein
VEPDSPRAFLLVEPEGQKDRVLGCKAYVPCAFYVPRDSDGPAFLFLWPESRHVQQLTLKVSPVQINYAPDGESLLYVSSGNQLFFMSYGKDPDDSATQAQWSPMDRAPVLVHSLPPVPPSLTSFSIMGALAADGIGRDVQSYG